MKQFKLPCFKGTYLGTILRNINEAMIKLRQETLGDLIVIFIEKRVIPFTFQNDADCDEEND
jgi:hypothetical protein